MLTASNEFIEQPSFDNFVLLNLSSIYSI
jgi:hypothetical protein